MPIRSFADQSGAANLLGNLARTNFLDFRNPANQLKQGIAGIGQIQPNIDLRNLIGETTEANLPENIGQLQSLAIGASPESRQAVQDLVGGVQRQQGLGIQQGGLNLNQLQNQQVQDRLGVTDEIARQASIQQQSNIDRLFDLQRKGQERNLESQSFRNLLTSNQFEELQRQNKLKEEKAKTPKVTAAGKLLQKSGAERTIELLGLNREQLGEQLALDKDRENFFFDADLSKEDEKILKDSLDEITRTNPSLAATLGQMRPEVLINTLAKFKGFRVEPAGLLGDNLKLVNKNIK